MLRLEIDNSSAIKAISWETGELTIEYVGGNKFHYLASKDVFTEYVNSVMDGKSAGSWYNTYIKGHYPGRRDGEDYPDKEHSFVLEVVVKGNRNIPNHQIRTRVVAALNRVMQSNELSLVECTHTEYDDLEERYYDEDY